MFYRTIWFYLFLLSMSCAAACDRGETQTVVSSPPPTIFPQDKKAEYVLSISEQCAATNNTYYLRYREDNQYIKDSPEYWSPDGQTAVVKLYEQGNQSLVLIYADDREPIVVRSGLAGLGHPYWSPDSQMFAFTQLVIPLVSKGIDLEIMDTAGNTPWSYSPFPLRNNGYNTLEWVACP